MSRAEALQIIPMKNGTLLRQSAVLVLEVILSN